MSHVKLSAVIITFNEEKNIGRCLDSLLSIADEYIVIDAFSTDQTINIIQARGIRPLQQEWLGYSATKNFANSLANGDFILSIDADEELSPELIRSIQEFKKNPVAAACQINRLTNYCGQWIRHSGWYPEYKIRIFRKGEAEWRGTVHEDLLFNTSCRPVRLKGNLFHYSFPTLESHVKKMISYSALAAEKDYTKGKKYNLLVHGLVKPWFAFMRTYFFQAGFLDGFYGFVIAISTGYERFLRYAKFRSLKK